MVAEAEAVQLLASVISTEYVVPGATAAVKLLIEETEPVELPPFDQLKVYDGVPGVAPETVTDTAPFVPEGQLTFVTDGIEIV